MDTLLFVGFILMLFLIPKIKQHEKLKEYNDDIKTKQSLGYHYDWDRFNQIQNEVREERYTLNKYQSTQEYAKEINRRCENEKLLNKSDLERK